jgi:hypothetical protein
MATKVVRTVAALAGAFLMIVSPVLAHHSFESEFDMKRPIRLTGTVTKVEWLNPHARFYIDVKEDGGKLATWELELGSPNGLMRQGWTRNTLKVGDVVVVSGFIARDGSRLASARSASLADGRPVFSKGSGESSRTKW